MTFPCLANKNIVASCTGIDLRQMLNYSISVSFEIFHSVNQGIHIPLTFRFNQLLYLYSCLPDFPLVESDSILMSFSLGAPLEGSVGSHHPSMADAFKHDLSSTQISHVDGVVGQIGLEPVIQVSLKEDLVL